MKRTLWPLQRWAIKLGDSESWLATEASMVDKRVLHKALQCCQTSLTTFLQLCDFIRSWDRMQSLNDASTQCNFHLLQSLNAEWSQVEKGSRAWAVYQRSFWELPRQTYETLWLCKASRKPVSALLEPVWLLAPNLHTLQSPLQSCHLVLWFM